LINFSLSFYYPQNTMAIKTGVSAFDCPSDPSSRTIEQPTSAYARTKADDMVNWGNMHYCQDQFPSSMPNPWTWSGSPFGSPLNVTTFLGAPFQANKSIGIQSIQDGTCDTLGARGHGPAEHREQFR
jgi:hypothetical protein